MIRLAHLFVTALLLGLTGYLFYAYGNMKGYEEAMAEVNRLPKEYDLAYLSSLLSGITFRLYSSEKT